MSKASGKRIKSGVKQASEESNMPKMPFAGIAEHFNKVNDPHMDWTKEHKLIDKIVLAIYAVICGAKGWTDPSLE